MSISALGSKKPEHVPSHLFWDYDFTAFCQDGDDPYIAASRLLDGPPVVYSPKAFYDQPAWVITSYAAMEDAFMRTDIFSNKRFDRKEEAIGEWRLIPVELDPPEHGKYRNVLYPYFTPKSVRSMEAMVQETCDSLIGAFENRGGCEFISDFGSRLPNLVFLKMMGLPTDQLDHFLVWENSIVHAEDPAERAAATKALMGYLMKFIAEQRNAPKTELMRLILNGRVDGRPFSEVEVLGTCFLLYVGGLDTVYSTLGWVFRQLASDQALQERLRQNPDDLTKAVEEFERAFAVARPTRTILKDCEFHGAPLRKGDVAILPTYIAARDPRQYASPHVVDIDRNARYLSFAKGPHLCLGIHLAKREIRMALEAFLSRFRNIRIPEGARYEYHVGGVFGVDKLPLVWDKI